MFSHSTDLLFFTSCFIFNSTNINTKFIKYFYCILCFREKPRINTQTVDIDYLRTLPDNTFGKAYANFLDINVSYTAKVTW